MSGITGEQFFIIVSYWVIHSITIIFLFINLNLPHDIINFNQQQLSNREKFLLKKRKISLRDRRFKIQYPGTFLDKKHIYQVCYLCL